jgi:hypothetical protein
MGSHLPSSLPAGFGVQDAGSESGANRVLWVDDRCREILLSFSPGRHSGLSTHPRVGVWVRPRTGLDTGTRSSGLHGVSTTMPRLRMKAYYFS